MGYKNPPEGVAVPFIGGWRGHQIAHERSLERQCKTRRLAKFRDKVSARTDGKCFYCLSLREDWTLEHLIPKSLGGTRALANLVRACEPCNSRRGNSPHIRKFMAFPTFERIARAAEQAIEAILRKNKRLT